MKKLRNKIAFYPENKELMLLFTNELKISPLIATILINRGITTLEAANMFLFGTMNDLHSPFLMNDMEKSINRIKEVINKKESVSIFGDYDVDGTTGTALLYQSLKKLGVDVHHSIPDRIDDGYGLSIDNINKSKELGIKLIISVDCGISNNEEVDYANSIGIDVIITDHHEPPSVLPNSYSILNPKKEGCNYPFKMLSGVGVAYKFVKALELSGFDVKADDYLDLNALGTIADITPLIDENRIIAKYGLKSMSNSKNYGIQSLLELADVDLKNVTTTHIGFQLAPRINASGRIGNADNSLKLFLAESRSEAMRYAKILDSDNKKRQQLEKGIMSDVEKQISTLEKDPCITLSSKNWHAGIIGIVASKIKDKFYKPTVLISIDDDNNCRGSARSINQFSLIDSLTKLSDTLIKFGGHKLAAGFSVEFDKIDELRSGLNKLVREELSDDDFSPTIMVDSILKFNEINNELMEELEILNPFGHCNPKPVFLTKDVSILRHRRVGKQQNHLLFQAEQHGKTIDGIGFNLGDFNEKIISPAQSINCIYELSKNNFNNKETIQLKLKDLTFSNITFFSKDENNIENSVKELRETGNRYYRQKDMDRAFDYYKRALELKNSEPELYFNIALIYKSKGDFDKTSVFLKKAIKFSPDNEKGEKIKQRANKILDKINF